MIIGCKCKGYNNKYKEFHNPVEGMHDNEKRMSCSWCGAWLDNYEYPTDMFGM